MKMTEPGVSTKKNEIWKTKPFLRHFMSEVEIFRSGLHTQNDLEGNSLLLPKTAESRGVQIIFTVAVYLVEPSFAPLFRFQYLESSSMKKIIRKLMRRVRQYGKV